MTRCPVSPDARKTDVFIAGAGFPGLALAIALRRALGPQFSVALADPALRERAVAPEQHARYDDPRASAIAAAARRLLGALGVWDEVADHAQPILDVAITDSRLTDAVRPALLSFAGEIEQGEPFAHMVPNSVLRAALLARAAALEVSFLPLPASDFVNADARALVRTGEDAAIAARLVVAADGAHSRLREAAGIETIGWDYPQAAIVTTVAHERDHQGRAYEHFLPAGPFATLPLKNRCSSLVWTEEKAEAERIVALPDGAFLAELERRFGLALGDIALAGPRRVYRLGFSRARTMIGERLALVGDAAHVIHPIAGQGLNMGLRDAAALAEVITDAVRLGLDPGARTVLERYQRWRQFDAAMMSATTDGLNRLFSNHSDVLRAVRDFGLGLVERLPGLKGFFVREAAGLTGALPKLLRGEAL